MGKNSIGKLPKLGEITVPVHLMTYDDKENEKLHFHSNFCFWKAADGTSDVIVDEKQIGSIGGTMGGHVEMNRYYPNNGEKHETSKYKQWTNVIVDVRDIWDQIESLLESKDVKVQIKGLEEVQEKYQKMMKKEKEKKEKIEEIKKMQLDAEEEARKEIENIEEKAKEEKKIKIASIIDSLKKEKESFQHVDGTYMIGKTEVYEDNNWDLKENLQGSDYEFYEYKNKKGIVSNRDSKGKIPVNIGCGIKVRSGDEMLLTDFKNEDKIVTLDISSWMGISPGAIHYYGYLEFDIPWLHLEKEPNVCQSNFDLKLLGRGKIELTHKLEAWELKKYPGAYDTYRVGNSYRGFYTREDVIKRGKEVLKDLFGEGWKLKIEKY